MAGKRSLYQKNLERIAKSMGTDLLPFIVPEERVSGLTLEERLHGLNSVDVRELHPETREKLKQLLRELEKQN